MPDDKCQVDARLHIGEVAILNGCFGSVALCRMHRDRVLCELASSITVAHEMLRCEDVTIEAANKGAFEELSSALARLKATPLQLAVSDIDPQEGLDDYDDRLR